MQTISNYFQEIIQPNSGYGVSSANLLLDRMNRIDWIIGNRSYLSFNIKKIIVNLSTVKLGFTCCQKLLDKIKSIS